MFYQPFLAYNLIDEGGIINVRRIVEAIDWEIFFPIATAFEEYAYRKSLEERRVKKAQEQDLADASDDLLFELPAPLSPTDRPTATGEQMPDPSPVLPFQRPGRPRALTMALLKAFVLSPYYEIPQNAEAVGRALRQNPAFLELCSFTKTFPPAPRTLRRFEQHMRESGLWGRIRQLLVDQNFADAYIQAEPHVVVDTSRHDACARVHKLSKEACEAAEEAEAAGEPVPKPGREDYTCDVTDVVAKSKGNRRPGVKSVLLGLPGCELPIVGLALPGNEPDAHTLEPVLQAFKDEHPDLAQGVQGVLADGIYNTAENQKVVPTVLPGAHLYTPIHPGRRKDRFVPDRGIGFLNKYGRPHCIMGHPMELLGRDEKKREFIWACPVYNPNCQVEGLTCDKKECCCPRATQGRAYRVPAHRTPQIDWDHPQFSHRFQKTYNLRTSIERIYGRGKRVLPYERLYNRGRKAFQGFVDRMIISLHLFARAACRLGHPELMRSIHGSRKKTA